VPAGKKLPVSLVASKRCGIHGRWLKAKRSPSRAMATPKGVESPGSGIGWHIGRERTTNNSV
jgi:hypothetical protein